MKEQSEQYKSLNLALWMAQVMLTALFLRAGFFKTIFPIPELVESFPWVTDFDPWVVRLVGIAEIIGGLGLLIPSLLRIKPGLSPIAAIGLIFIMVFAAIYHIAHQEYGSVVINAFIAILAYFIAWGRLKKARIIPRGKTRKEQL